MTPREYNSGATFGKHYKIMIIRRITGVAGAVTMALAMHTAGAQQKAPQEGAKKEAASSQQASSGSSAQPNVAMCTGCHGIPGYKTAFPTAYHVPLIGGQQPAYIVAALKAYKSGERTHPSMRGIAASLTEKDMEALAAYYGASK